jgi:hypothetical protein
VIHDNVLEASRSARCGEATVAITNGTAALSISSNEADRAGFVGREFAVVMEMVRMIGGGGLRSNIVVGTRSLIVELLELFELMDGCKDRSRVKGEVSG